jgi:hypothetical protein
MSYPLHSWSAAQPFSSVPRDGIGMAFQTEKGGAGVDRLDDDDERKWWGSYERKVMTGDLRLGCGEREFTHVNMIP